MIWRTVPSLTHARTLTTEKPRSKLGSLGYVHLPQLGGRAYLGRCWILDQTVFEAELFAILEQSITPVDSAIWQDDGVVLDIAFRVVRIRDFSGKLVQFSRANGTYRSSRRASIRRAACVL